MLSVTLAPYGALDGEGGVIAVIHDVTEQRRLDDARREFVANVSHELRTPLTNIRSYTETLLDAAGELPLDTEKQFLGVISSESERMARIVTDLLTLSAGLRTHGAAHDALFAFRTAAQGRGRDEIHRGGQRP